jgi:hypothetical protein
MNPNDPTATYSYDSNAGWSIRDPGSETSTFPANITYDQGPQPVVEPAVEPIIVAGPVDEK